MRIRGEILGYNNIKRVVKFGVFGWIMLPFFWKRAWVFCVMFHGFFVRKYKNFFGPIFAYDLECSEYILINWTILFNFFRMEEFKKYILVSGREGFLQLQNIAQRFEENNFVAATFLTHWKFQRKATYLHRWPF